MVEAIVLIGAVPQELHVLGVVGRQVDDPHDPLDDRLMHGVVVAAAVLAPGVVRGADLVGDVREHDLAVGLAHRLGGGGRLNILALRAADGLDDPVALVVAEQIVDGDKPRVAAVHGDVVLQRRSE